MRDLANKMSDIAMVSLIRDTRTIMYAGVVIRKRSTFCQRDMKVTLNKKNKVGLIFLRTISLNWLASIERRRRIISHHL